MDGLGANKVKESRTPDWDGGVVGKSEEARYQFGTGQHLLTKLRMKDGGMRAYKSRERPLSKMGTWSKRKIRCESEAWKEVENPC